MENTLFTTTKKKLTIGGLFMKGKAWPFSALSATEDLPAGAEGAKAAAEPARRAREVTFIMVKTFVGERVKAEKRA